MHLGGGKFLHRDAAVADTLFVGKLQQRLHGAAIWLYPISELPPKFRLPTGITQTLHIYLEEYAPGGRTQKHGHVNEAALYILDGRGYEIHDGVRYDWQAGDGPIDRRSRTIKNHGQKFTLRLIKRLARRGNVTLLRHCAEDQRQCHRHVLNALILSNRV